MIRLLDLFCGAGGCTKGYQMAGFHVTGVDMKASPRYCGDEFHQGDALEFLAAHGHEYDAIHASPPCQAYSLAAKGTGKTYPNLLPKTRELLTRSGRPWIIENVPGAPMEPCWVLCGCMFGLELRRRRLFETNWAMPELMPECSHDGPVLSVVGHGTPTWVRDRWQRDFGRNPNIHDYRQAMGIAWMNRDELSQAIPPAYTKWIGDRLMAHILEERAA